MGHYINNALVEGEQILHEGNPSAWGHPKVLALVLICVAGGFHQVTFGSNLVAAGVFFAVAALAVTLLRLIIQSTELAVTDRRVLAKTGIILRNTSELYLARVEGVEVKQGLFGRLMGFGTVLIRGTGEQVAEIRNISDPLTFRKKVFSAGDAQISRNVRES